MASTWSPPKSWDTRPICVLGGGVLGRRIAACFVASGYHVRIRDPSAKSRSDACDYIEDQRSVYARLSNYQAGSVEAVEDFEAGVKDCWLVFEAVPEILSLKETTYHDLEEHAPADCILASNSSSYKSGELLGKVKNETKTRALNTHYMMPPKNIIVELMTSGHTAEGLIPFLAERHREVGLHPVVALKESTGFIFNRIWASIKREVLSVLAEGVATPETVDAIWTEQFGSIAGPCKMMDGVGLDTVQHIEEHYIKDRQLPTYHLDWLVNNYINSGKLGAKSENGGLYAPRPEGTSTRILILNTGLLQPLSRGKNLLSSGQILSWTVENKLGSPTELVGNLPIPDGIDMATSTKRIYWTNMGNPLENDGTVKSAKLDGTDIVDVVPKGGVHTPKQLTIDQEAEKIYFCDREGLRVMRCNLDGSDHETILQTGDWRNNEHKGDGTFWPVGITISKKLNKFFWTQKGGSKASTGRIFSAGINMPSGASASSRPDIEIVMEGLPECIDLEFDDEEGILYWTDRGELPLGNTLNKKQIIGTAPEAEKPLGRQIIAQGLGEGIGLRLDRANNCLYVADLSGHLWKCSPSGGLKEKLLEDASHSYTGLCFYRV